jgi:hypothetical protein
MEIVSVIFTYKIWPLNSNISKAKKSELTEKVKTTHFKGVDLPNTMDFTMWGAIIFQSDTLAFVKKKGSNIFYNINIFEKHTNVEVKQDDRILIDFTDEMMNQSNLNSFKRTLKNKIYIFVDGEIKLKTIKKKTLFLKTQIKSFCLSEKFITMDLETRTINGIMSVYCVSIFDGKKVKSFFIQDFKSVNEMIVNSLRYLMRNKYDKHRVYLHNFSNFDAIFLIDILASLTDKKLNPVIKDGRFIEFPFKFNKNIIYFRDSLQILPMSLSQLADSFEIEKKKGFFPHNFLKDKNISLNYNGNIPDFKYFNNYGINIEEYIKEIKPFKEKTKLFKRKGGLTPDDYNILIKSKTNWNLREESIKYCENDVIVLYNIIKKFSMKIFELFRVDIIKYPTLASLAFGIYRSNFYRKDELIPIITGSMYDNMKNAYTGGSVDVYKPHGYNIYSYDVNSLYPTQMANYDMPVGSPTYFEGDINLREEIKNPFGIFEVEVTSPDNLNYPILQLRFKTKNGIKTISPLGKWKSWYFSEELYNAIKYGYKFNIIRGYIFERKNIFKKYVNCLYDIKKKSDKDSVNYLIAKLLLNSLYGRFGMSPLLENHLIVSPHITEKMINSDNIIVKNVVNLKKSGKELITFFDDKITNNNRRINVSIPISIAVTAYGRIFMSIFKMKFLEKDIKLYYSDTDCVHIDKELDNKFLGDNLGQFKFEKKNI